MISKNIGYLGEISDIELLTREEEIELSKKIIGKNPKGKEEAKLKLFEHNLRFVVTLAHNFKNKGLDLNDLIGEGNQGLRTAVEKYDYRKEVKFSTYAQWWIKQSIRNEIANKSKVIRVPIHANEKITEINYANEDLKKKLGYPPSDEMIAEYINKKRKDEGRKNISFTAKKVRKYKMANIQICSIHNPIKQGGSETLENIIPDQNMPDPEEILEKQDNIKKLEKILHELNEREQTIIKMRFEIGYEKSYTLEEVAKKVGLTRERVRQIQNRTIEKLKYKIQSKSNNSSYSRNSQEYKDHINWLINCGPDKHGDGSIKEIGMSPEKKKAKSIKIEYKGSISIFIGEREIPIMDLVEEHKLDDIINESERGLIGMCTRMPFEEVAKKTKMTETEAFKKYVSAMDKIRDYMLAHFKEFVLPSYKS